MKDAKFRKPIGAHKMVCAMEKVLKFARITANRVKGMLTCSRFYSCSNFLCQRLLYRYADFLRLPQTMSNVDDRLQTLLCLPLRSSGSVPLRLYQCPPQT